MAVCLQLLQNCYITVLCKYGLISVLFAQNRGVLAFLNSVTAVLFHHSAMDTWTDCGFLVQGRGESAILSAVTAVLLHHYAMDIWTDFSVISTG